MVATHDRRASNPHGHTEELVKLISKFRTKKMCLRKRRSRDLRVEALLTNVLTRAQEELRVKQQQRLRKWLEVRSELGVCNEKSNSHYEDVWREKDLGLDSLHSFMMQLKEVKTPVHR